MTDRPNRAEVGKIGEDTACAYLQKHGFKIVERNYWQKWGEIDVVAEKNKVLHFVEVKAVARTLYVPPKDSPKENPLGNRDKYEPEGNVHSWKLQRLRRAIQTYLLQRHVPDEQEWQVDVLSIELDFESRRARVKMLSDIRL